MDLKHLNLLTTVLADKVKLHTFVHPCNNILTSAIRLIRAYVGIEFAMEWTALDPGSR